MSAEPSSSPSSALPHSPDPDESFSAFSTEDIARLAAVFEVHEEVKEMSDQDLSDAVINEVWAKLRFCSRQDWLLDEMIARFDKRCGIVRGEEDGEVVSVDPLAAALNQTLAQGHPVIVDAYSPTADFKQVIVKPISQ